MDICARLTNAKDIYDLRISHMYVERQKFHMWKIHVVAVRRGPNQLCYVGCRSGKYDLFLQNTSKKMSTEMSTTLLFWAWPIQVYPLYAPQ